MDRSDGHSETYAYDTVGNMLFFQPLTERGERVEYFADQAKGIFTVPTENEGPEPGISPVVPPVPVPIPIPVP